MRQRVNVRVVSAQEEKTRETGERYMSQSMIVAWYEKDAEGNDIEQLVKGSMTLNMQEWYKEGGFKVGDDIDVDMRFRTRNGKEGGVYQSITFWA